MHCWPECPVRETIIIFPTIKWRQVQEHVLDILFVDYSGQRTRLGCHPAAPAEPEPLIALKRLSQCNGQSTGCAFAGDVGNRTPLETTTRRGKEALQHGPSLKRRAPYHSIKPTYMTRCVATAIMRNVGSFGRSHD